MKILQVVTYVSKDGAFGGPVAVALSQSAALVARGHAVILAGGWDGVMTPPPGAVQAALTRVSRLVPPLGLSGLWSPRLVIDLARRTRDADVVHIHFGRDLVSVTAALLSRALRKPMYLQTHGMLAAPKRRRNRLFDLLLGRRLLQRAEAVLCLTDAEAADIDAISRGQSRRVMVTNGVDCQVDAASLDRVPNKTAEVLFLARLHPRKRVGAFLEMASLVNAAGVQADFVVIGPDEGDLHEVERAIRQSRPPGLVKYEGVVKPGEGAARIRNATVYVLPSVGEVVPMAVLEAMSVGTPVVITESCGLAPTLREASAGMVTDGTPAELAKAVVALLRSSSLAGDLSRRARDLIRDEFSAAAVAERLELVYDERQPAPPAVRP